MEAQGSAGSCGSFWWRRRTHALELLGVWEVSALSPASYKSPEAGVAAKEAGEEGTEAATGSGPVTARNRPSVPLSLCTKGGGSKIGGASSARHGVAPSSGTRAG